MISTIHSAVSDLFFNHEHEHYERVCRENELEDSPIAVRSLVEAAINLDAQDFVEAYGEIIVDCPMWQELASDFLKRL